MSLSTYRKPRSANIAIIGGGSLYCANLMRSISQQPDTLQGCHITLMDINEDHLELIYSITTKQFQQENVPVTLSRTTNQEEALEGADFVLTTFRTGGLQARHLDERLPLQYDVIGHDSIGPGGFFYALRTAPVLAGIAALIEKVAPKALLLNYTNPSSIILEAIAHSSGIRVIGLEEDSTHYVRHLATLAGIDISPTAHITLRTVGVSHASWTTAVWLDGENILPHIVSWCEHYTKNLPPLTPENHTHLMRILLTARYNSIPSQFMHYYYFPEQVLGFQKQQTQSQAEHIRASLSNIIAYYRAESVKTHPQFMSSSIKNPYSPSSLKSNPLYEYNLDSLLLSTMRAILHDTGEELVLNVQNKGAIQFLEDDHIIRVPCHVDKRGAIPLAQENGGLTMDQRGLIALLAEYEGATARVALWGNRRDAIKALASNPLVMSYSKAEQLYDEMAAAHASHLPKRLLS